mmetsp:Transcript_21839/g.36542  ORF Transcript_21839/g.36542 Transcript_21839/m.36542 type:complete len:390 (+) Transcript_21839:56-1225(+)
MNFTQEVPATAVDSAPAETVDSPEPEWREDWKIRIKGLKSRPDMNNSIVEFASAEQQVEIVSTGSGRKGVVILESFRETMLPSTERVKSVKPENLHSCDPAFDFLFQRNRRVEIANEEFANTVCLVLYDMICAGCPIVLANEGEHSNCFHFLIAGASWRYETSIDYIPLFDRMKTHFYPSLEKLEITLCGPELQKKPATTLYAGRIVIKTHVGPLEKQYSKGISSRAVDLAGIFVPGFSSYVDQWKPAICDVLIANGIPTMVTGYSDVDTVTDDALFDEDAVRTYFGGKVIVTSSKNPHYSAHKPRWYKNAYYFVFKGVDFSTACLSRADYRKRLLAKYMRFQGDYYRTTPGFLGACESIAKDVERGALDYNQSTSDLVQLANMRMFNF